MIGKHILIAESTSMSLINFLISPPPPQIIMFRIFLALNFRMRANPVVRQLVVPRQSVLPSTWTFSASIKPTSPIQSTVAIGSSRARHGIQAIQIHAFMCTRCWSWTVSVLGQEKNMPQIRKYASRNSVVTGSTFDAIVEEPLAEGEVLFSRVLPDILSCHDELCAALSFHSIATSKEDLAGWTVSPAEDVG
jgi:hypothetical protein